MSDQQQNSGITSDDGHRQQQQYAPSTYQQGGKSTSTLAPAFQTKVIKQDREPLYQELPFLGIAKQLNDRYEVQGVNHAEELISRSQNDGAKLRASAYRPIGNSGCADLIAVFEGPFNKAQKDYLYYIRKVPIPATDPNLENVKPWTSGSRPTKTEDSFARPAPD